MVAESGWLIDRQLGPSAEAALYESAAAGEIRVEPLSAADWTRIAALTIQYADQHLGGVDSSLVAIAERLGTTSVGTLDRRHFGLVRLSTSPASSCFRKSASHFHDCILPLAFTDRVPSGVDPAAPLQRSHDPDYPHPLLVAYVGGG